MRGPSPSRSQNLAGFGAIGDLMNGPVEECPVQSRNVKMAATPTMSAPDHCRSFSCQFLSPSWECSGPHQVRHVGRNGLSGISEKVSEKQPLVQICTGLKWPPTQTTYVAPSASALSSGICWPNHSAKMVSLFRRTGSEASASLSIASRRDFTQSSSSSSSRPNAP